MYLMTQQFCTRQNEDPTTRAICVETRSHTHMPEMVDIKHAERCRKMGYESKTYMRYTKGKMFLCITKNRTCFLDNHGYK